MTHTNAVGPTLRSWQKWSGSRFGRWLFARKVSRRIPYAGTLKPHVIELRPALCRVSFAKRKRVQGTRGTVHSLAIANLCELAAEMVTEVSVPPTLRWVTRGMTIEYLRKAETAVTATSSATAAPVIAASAGLRRHQRHALPAGPMVRA